MAEWVPGSGYQPGRHPWISSSWTSLSSRETSPSSRETSPDASLAKMSEKMEVLAVLSRQTALGTWPTRPAVKIAQATAGASACPKKELRPDIGGCGPGSWGELERVGSCAHSPWSSCEATFSPLTGVIPAFQAFRSSQMFPGTALVLPQATEWPAGGTGAGGDSSPCLH